MEQFCSSSRVLFILFLMTCQASIVITVSAIVCVFVCLFLFDWASSVFAAISWCGSAILSQRAAKTPRTSCPTAQNQVSNQLLLCSPIKGFPFQMKHKVNCLLQANTVWVHSTHLSAKKANFTARLYQRLSSCLHRQLKLLVARWKGKPCSHRLYLERYKVSLLMSPLSFYTSKLHDFWWIPEDY